MLQNLCEFWNVCARPQTARGGLGLTLDETYRRLRTIERIAVVLPESSSVVSRWKELVIQYKVQSVQVHDTRLVASMDASGITQLLTLNPVDFRRFAHILIHTPESLLSG